MIQNFDYAEGPASAPGLGPRPARPGLSGLSPDELETLVTAWGEPAYRARQLFSWVHGGRARSFEEMSNLPRGLRETLAVRAVLDTLTILERRKARDGTTKYLFRLSDGETVEAVWIPAPGRRTVCLSSQVGCAIGCRFCATGWGGLVRNLTAAEIVDQVRLIARDTGQRPTNLVFMGMGEPLANYGNVRRAMELLHAPAGFGIGWRHHTLSTSGIVPGIRRLAGERLPITLAVSLHAADDETRSMLVPLNRRWPISELLKACREYVACTGRRISFEYVLIRGINDTRRDARRLAGLLAGILSHVNLIPLNRVPEVGWEAPSPARQREFARLLEEAGLSVTLRQERGGEIEAACGQLRRRYTPAPAGVGV